MLVAAFRMVPMVQVVYEVDRADAPGSGCLGRKNGVWFGVHAPFHRRDLRVFP
jgi:hypothetical protein